MDGFSIRAIIAIDSSKNLFTTNSPGWFQGDRRTNETTQLYSTLENTKIFPSYGLKKESNNIYWTTKKNEIVKVKYPTDILESYQYENWTGLNGFTESKDDLFLAVHSSITQFDIKTKKQENIDLKHGKKLNYILAAYDNYIIQCTEEGLFMYDLDLKTNRHIIDNKKHYVAAYLEDNHLYVSTYDGTIEVFLKDKDGFQLLDSMDIGKVVFCMEKDQKGRLWLGTDNGVYYQINASVKDFSQLNLSDQAAPEANRYSIFFDSIYNMMYIGTVNGVNKIDTYFDHAIDSFNIKLASYFSYENDSLTRKHSWEREEEIKIPTRNRYLQLKLADELDIYNNNVAFEYRIEGGNWQSQNNKNTITLANLDGGNQVLQIRGTSDAGIRSTNIISIPIRVGKYFFETWWFRIGLTVLIGSLIFAWINRIRKENIKLEKEVAKRTDELEKDKAIIENQANELMIVDKMKNRFFSNISHELKTPLTLIKSPIDRLNKMNLSEDAKYYISLIEGNGIILKDRVEELLEISRLEGNKVELDRNRVNLRSVINLASGVFAGKMQDRNIDYEVKIDVPNVIVILDRTRLIKLIQNLISNAIKFSEKGGRITAHFNYDDKYLKFSISDTGIGMEEYHLNKIFDRFYQIPVDDTMANPGTGLGLSMVLDYLNLMDGEVKVYSTLGEGTQFNISIPLVSVEKDLELNEYDTEIDEALLVAKTASKQISKDKTDKPILLIVEDHDQLRSYIGVILSDEYQIIEARDGKEALRLLEEGLKFDMILSDIMMPELDGVSLFHKVRNYNEWSLKPFIFLSAKSNLLFKVNLIRQGVDDYLTKPFSERELKARLSAIYQNYCNRIAAQNEVESEDEDVVASISEFELSLQKIIKENLYHPQFGTEFISSQLGVSRRTLQRTLKREIGLSPKAYIREVQLDIARQIEEQGKYKSVSELARAAGFANSTYFKRLYFERFGKRI